MEVLAVEFKDRSLKTIDNVVDKLKEYKGELPFNLGLVEMAKNFFIHPIDGDCLVNMFIEDSMDSWDAIHNRDEDALIATFTEEVGDRAPAMQGLFKNIIDFGLKNRRDLFEESYENFLWEEVGELVKIAIRYAHLRRVPKVKPDGSIGYTKKYMSKLSIKKNAEKWGVEL